MCRGNAVVIIKRIHVTDALAIILNFYGYQVALGLANYLDPITDVSSRSLSFFSFVFFWLWGVHLPAKVQPPTVSSYQMRLYPSSADPAEFGATLAPSQSSILQNGTPLSAHGESRTPAQASSVEEILEKAD